METKKQRSEVDREKINLSKEEHAHKSKMGEIQIEKKQLEQARTNFKLESETQERDLKLKLQQVTDSMREARKEETLFSKKKQEFEVQYSKV